MKKSLLYIINFYGSPPLNYFEKYINETQSARLTILKLPSVRTSKYRLIVDSFIKDENGIMHNFKLNVFLPLPYFMLFLLQYLLNTFLVFHLLGKIKSRVFDIAIGETNFGSAVCYLLRTIGKVKYSTYFNGDILPDSASSSRCFFLPNPTRYHSLYKIIDTLLLKVQESLRKIGYSNDNVWYGNEMIRKWDESRGYTAKSYFVEDPILINYQEFKIYSKTVKNKNAICYIGRIDEYVGLDIIIKALPKIKEKIPRIKLHVIGGSGIVLEKYKTLAEKLDLVENVHFYGFMPNMKDALSIMSKCSLGMALYKPVKDNVSMFSQPAKPKEYIKVGLPVLVTEGGPQIGKEIVELTAGIASSYDPDSVAKVIIRVLTNEIYYAKLRKGVEKYAHKNHYFNIFKKVWSRILEYEIR